VGPGDTTKDSNQIPLSVSSRAYWERTKHNAANAWTAHSTMTAAKNAQAQGMPEPPPSFFETQERLVEFFHKHGEQRVYMPDEVVMEPGMELSHLFLIEEGSVCMQKDVKVIRRAEIKQKPAKSHADEVAEASEVSHRMSIEAKGFEMATFRQKNTAADDASSRGSYMVDNPNAKSGGADQRPLTPSTLNQEPEAAQLVETVKLTTLEQDELVGEVAFIEGTPLEVRYVSDSEGCALRSLPAEKLWSELHKDPVFAGLVFKNIAITLSVKCEEILWRLEEMASEAASSGWRAPWRRGGALHQQKFKLPEREVAKVKQVLDVAEGQELLHSTTAAFDHLSIRVHGHLLIFQETLCFYAKVFGTQVKKSLPVQSIVSVLQNTPATKGMDAAVEVACLEDAYIFSNIPDHKETCAALNEMIKLAERKLRGAKTQNFEFNDKGRDAAREALESIPRSANSVKEFQLSPEEWLEFLQREAQSQIYNRGEPIVRQNSQCDCMFQIASGCVRVEKATTLGDGTVVVSRLGPPAVFGEFFFLMGDKVTSLTSFICDMDDTELYLIKPSSLQQYNEKKPMMLCQLYRYLATSTAHKYRVLRETSGFGITPKGAGTVQVPMEEVMENPVFLGFYSRYLRIERAERLPWLQFWQAIEEFRVLPQSTAANKAAHEIYNTYVREGSAKLPPISAQELLKMRAAFEHRSNQGQKFLLPSDTFATAQAETLEALRLHTYDKFVSSSYLNGIIELKEREKEVPTVHHFYYLRRLGVGSFGEVYAVRKKDSHKRYAMKIMGKEAQAQMSRRWAMYVRIESEVMAALNHPFLVNLNYCFQTPQAVFMVLDLVLGGDLDDFQKRFRSTPVTDDMLRFMASQLVSGLAYMHSVGVIHRDIKPPNVLIDESGNLRITDFGLSLKLKPGEELFDRTGTKPYMAPELHLASKSAKLGYSYSVDWYATGVTLWEVCTGGLVLPPPVQSIVNALKCGENITAKHFEPVHPSAFKTPAFSNFSQEATDFLYLLLHPDASKRLNTEAPLSR